MDAYFRSDIELLRVLLGAKTAERLLAKDLLQMFLGTEEDGVPPRIVAARELMRRALEEECRFRNTLASPQAVRDYLKLLFSAKEHEVFVVLCLDAQHRVIATEELFQGTLTQTSVYPREVVKCVLRHNAAAAIFAHNHPSGVAQPSQADELLTRQLKEALALVDVKVLDHFIIAGTANLSFAERGLL